MPARVIAGSAKGRRLKLVPGSSTRPIMDRVKEALFSIIGREIYDANVLDLFAGTGSVGIEALSRGARQAVFLDLDRNAIRTIHENLKITGFTEKAIVRRTDALNLLKSPPLADAYDYIYIAPPQYKGMWLEALNLLDANPGWLVDESASVIVQIDPKEYQEIALKNLVLVDQRDYGRTMLLFYERVEASEAEAE
jgi:16S rRNA (guanine(966)-N(2))-methyltransferase RsmD